MRKRTDQPTRRRRFSGAVGVFAATIGSIGGMGGITVAADVAGADEVPNTCHAPSSYDTDALAIAAGTKHSLLVAGDTTASAWGDNEEGQLGDDTLTDSAWPVGVHDLEGVTGMAGGDLHSLAVKSDGTAWAWGESWNLGRASTLPTASRTPVQVELTGVTAVAAAGPHSLALRNDGTVWAWGYGSTGQLGNGTLDSSRTPVQVTGLTNVTAIASGEFHNLALKSDGTVWAWGFGSAGQLGYGGTANRTTATQVSGLTGVVAIAGGADHSLAVKSDGTLWAWGSNTAGQIGNPSTMTGFLVPVQVSGLTGAAGVAAGNDTSYVRKTDGTVWAFGANYAGQLGTGGIGSASSSPVRVGTLTNIASIAAGRDHALAREIGGRVWAWGVNDAGQLGDGTTAAFRASPVQVSTADADDGVCVDPGIVVVEPPVGLPSSTCEQDPDALQLLDAFSLGAHVKAYALRVSTTELAVCVRAEDPDGTGIGGKVSIAPALPGADVTGIGLPTIGVPTTDTDSDACSATTPNQVPSPHPATAGTILGLPFLFDTYLNGSGAWVCLQAVTATGTRVIVPFTPPTVGTIGVDVTPAYVLTIELDG